MQVYDFIQSHDSIRFYNNTQRVMSSLWSTECKNGERLTCVYVNIDFRVIECYCLLKYLKTIEDIVSASLCVYLSTYIYTQKRKLLETGSRTWLVFLLCWMRKSYLIASQKGIPKQEPYKWEVKIFRQQ